jgi:hypothetical protein
MDTRTILGALRRRRRGEAQPSGGGPWTARIRRGWKLRDFGLGWRFPWIATVDELLDAGREQDDHSRLLGDAWDRDRRLADALHLRVRVGPALPGPLGDHLASWVGLDAERGARRFEKLIEEATVEHRDIVQLTPWSPGSTAASSPSRCQTARS